MERKRLDEGLGCVAQSPASAHTHDSAKPSLRLEGKQLLDTTAAGRPLAAAMLDAKKQAVLLKDPSTTAPSLGSSLPQPELGARSSFRHEQAQSIVLATSSRKLTKRIHVPLPSSTIELSASDSEAILRRQRSETGE